VSAGRRLRRATALAGLVLAGLPASPALAMEPEQARTFAECDPLIHERPQLYGCHRMVAQRDRTWSDALRHLEARLAANPDDHESRLALGAVREAILDPQGDDDLRRAADGLAAARKYEAEGFARLDLFHTLGDQSRLPEAEAELRRAEEDQALSGSPVLARYVEYHRGLHAQYLHDYAGATVRFNDAAALAEAADDNRLRAMVSNGLGTCAFFLGQSKEAFDHYRRSTDLFHAIGDFYTEADVLYNVGLAASRAGMPDAERVRISEEGIAAARRSGNLKTEGQFLFGKAQEREDAPLEERLGWLRQALAIVRPTRNPSQIGFVMRYTAVLLAQAGRRREADAMLDEAIEVARRSGDPEQLARGQLRRAQIHGEAGERDRALVEWNATLDAIESLRDLQRDDAARASFESSWAFLYYQVAAYCLQKPGPAAAVEDVDRALTVIERMRARVLLDSLDAAGAATGGAPGELQRRRAEALDGISRLQRRLLSPILPETERAALLRDLDALENRERGLRADMARADPSFATLRSPSLAALARIQEALHADQALLSFQSDQRSSHPSWALLVTRDAVRTAVLPDRAPLASEVSLFLGLLERRDGSEVAGAARLYKDLLGDLLQTLPGGITRLVIVPDGPLHRVPFDALRKDAAAEPLAARFDIALAPSCSTWLRWTGAGQVAAEHPVLAIADPHLIGGEGPAATSRAATLATGLRLGSLPGAREEAGQMVRRLGGGSRMVAGSEATERFLKTADLSSYRMLHLGAHAVVDEVHPERSAVLLAPGSDEDDGLLQVREIVNLDLKGRMVILPSCSSASGAFLDGEGVMGLARAFSQAGAVGLVGGLWPLRDRETARLTEDMAERLGRGESIGAALAAARRDAMKSGAPAAAWAGLVVLGDGDFVPLPGGRAPLPDVRRFATLVGALALGGVGLLLVRNRLRRPSPAA